MNPNTHYFRLYKTPHAFDDMLMESDGEALIGLLFVDGNNTDSFVETDLPIFAETARWLDMYFSGREPDFVPNYKVIAPTPFRKEVYEVMLSIPFGNVLTYGDIARIIAHNHNIPKMSAQAVGNAVGSNPICLIIPCHRVIGANNRLGGYGGGVENKKALLRLEGRFIPYRV